MGYGRWSDKEFTSYATRTAYTTKSINEVFTCTKLHASLDPSKIVVRESCDSDANPNSTPIIFGLDVTGSMGSYAHQIATTELPKLMRGIHEQGVVSDPHIMFMGVGDVFSDQAPLQVSQFEAGAEVIVESLRNIYIEGNGGGNNSESYDLPWYFAANFTKVDCVKRGQRGMIFTFGDELCPSQPLTAEVVKRVFGTKDLPSYASTEALLADVEKNWQVFHVIIEQGSYCRRQGADRVAGSWRKLMGNNAIRLRDASYLTDVVIAAARIAQGDDVDAVIGEATAVVAKELRYAFGK
jgi:hypothetical protein